MAGLLDYASSVAGEAKKNVQGLLADPKQALMDILNNLTARAAASQAKTKAAWATRDPKVMAQNALDSSQTALGFAPLGITAWHGSPHKFNKFSMDKIGTGEGAQAYGHGLYLAEAPEVAQAYANKLTTVNGQAVSDQLDGRVRYLNMLKQQAADGDVNAAKNVPVIEKSIAELKNQGSLYKTDIPDEAVARFLDWDKPLSQQAPEVQAALSSIAKGSMTGEQAWKAAIRQSGNPFSNLTAKEGAVFSTPEAASSNLNRLGINGIRYLDGGSRGAGQGSSNFVVFDPEMIRILERNGQATGAAPWQPGEWRGLLGNN